jgi:4-carboxymuconolactone decarboxylase
VADYTSEFIWGAVWARPELDIRYRMLANLGILSTLQRMSQLRTYINSALNMGLSPEEVVEVFIHCSMYAGFPTAVNSLELAREIFEQRGIEASPEAPVEVPLEEQEARGLALWETLVGDADDSGYAAAVEAVSPYLNRLHLRYGLGELFQRPGLDLKSRVVCTLAALVSLRADPELRTWLGAAVRAGFSREEVVELLVHTAPYAGFPAAMNAMAIAAEALPSES